jgi:glycosyltransferase involved in cell wall biosynthesis
MKILHITKYLDAKYGGIETYTDSLCKALHKQYKKIDVISFGKKKKILVKKNYKIIFFPINFIIFSAPVSIKLFFFLKKEIKKYKLIHVYLPNPWVVVLIYLFAKKHNKIIISWGSDIINQKISKIILNFFQEKLLKISSKIIGLSKIYTEYSYDLKKFKYKISIIPPILKNVNFIKKKHSNKVIILFVGRLVKYKGLDVLIKSLTTLPNKYSIKIIGDGPEYKKLFNLTLKYKLNDRIIFLKNATDNKKNSELKKASIFCMCSKNRAESFGISLLEAINYSLPVVVSNIKGSGMKEMIINNYNGFLFKNNSPIDLANKIKKIGDSKKIINVFSKNSKELFIKKFSGRLLSQKIINIYKKILLNN